ncbi:hypothetical protein G646_gp124 [Serratia phage phiMAM1]|uniref:Uncharacterized protein n=1 Tax=Serratia phage phiMAM1 TaxID=1262513 RepID=K7YB71_9CAUD|nr:hypothetical protein G646_gp124 [Serratia phage phiMAM1]AFX93592.1 hypothetical protein MAM_124 [Serratia phage phiMAM1]
MSKINHAHAAVFESFISNVGFQFTKEEHEAACENNCTRGAYIDVLLAETKGDLTLYISATINRMWLFEGDNVVLYVDDFQWDEGGAEYNGTLVANAYSNGFTKYLWN